MFNPEKFENWNGAVFNFVLQDEENKNCGKPIEEKTVNDLRQGSVRNFTATKVYEFSENDLEIEFTHMPALAKRGLITNRVRNTI
jgi:hypothetical protein